MKASVVDLFCGAGGMTHGFVKEQLNVVAGIDLDSTCKYAYEENNDASFINKDINKLTKKELLALFPKDHIKILVGCAPCQPFSTYARANKNNGKDKKWSLLYTFAKLIAQINPEIVSMENVPGLMKYDKSPIFEDFVNQLGRSGYYVTHRVVYCPDYGIPQRRKRLVLLASKFGDIPLIKKTHPPSTYLTVRKTISGLEPITAGEIGSSDPLHRSRSLSAINQLRIKSTPIGGGWKDWNDNLVLKCHKKKKGRSYGSVYGRMRWDDVAPTMTTQCTGLGNGRYGHPEQNRAISLREAALFQTFKKHYKFIDPDVPFSFKNIERQIGNAVPVRLGAIIARSIKRHLESN